MSFDLNRIPDEMLADVLAEATRLHAEATAGYSFEDLQQACAGINIPPHMVKEAIATVKNRRSQRKLAQERFQAMLKQQFLKALPMSAAIFCGAAPIVGFIWFYPRPEPPEVAYPLTTMTVKEGQLKYLDGPKDLSIALRSVSRDGEIAGVIGMDAYQELELGKKTCRKIIESLPPSCDRGPAKVGESYIYPGLQTYQVKILEIKDETVVFQVDRVDQKVVSPAKRLEAKLESLQKESDGSQEVLQKQLDQLEQDNASLKSQKIRQEAIIKELNQENDILKRQKTVN
jgi:hypothetical protein